MGHAARDGRILEPSPPGSEVPGTMAVHDRRGRGRARLARSSPWFGLVLSALLALGRVVVIAPLRGARERGCDLCARCGCVCVGRDGHRCGVWNVTPLLVHDFGRPLSGFSFLKRTSRNDLGNFDAGGHEGTRALRRRLRERLWIWALRSCAAIAHEEGGPALAARAAVPAARWHAAHLCEHHAT